MRVQPNHLLNTIVGNNRLTVTECEGLFAVLYQGKAINYRREHAYIDGQPFYKRTVFVTSSSAHAAAHRLNTLFNTTDFKVFNLVPGDLVPDEE